jgi:hypothetical protein
MFTSFKAANEAKEIAIREQIKQLEKQLEIIVFKREVDIIKSTQNKFEQKNLIELCEKKKKKRKFFIVTKLHLFKRRLTLMGCLSVAQ